MKVYFHKSANELRNKQKVKEDGEVRPSNTNISDGKLFKDNGQ